MMTFKELIDKTTVEWADNLIQERTDSLANELKAVNPNELIPGLNFNSQDAIDEFNRIKAQLPVLKTYADVFGYAKMNSTDLVSVINNGLTPDQIQKMMGGEMGTPNLAKIIAKVQIGSVFSVIDNCKPLVTSLLDKIGRDTPVNEVNNDDINYLLTKSIDQEVDDILDADEATHLLGEVSQEVNQLKDPSASWDKKNNDRQIIEIYLQKLRDRFLASPMQRGILTQGAPMNSLRVKVGTKIMADMSILGAKIEYGFTLENDLINVKKN